MKNVPVPVYCRPLVEKDPTMKVPPWSLGPAGGDKAGKGSTWLSPGRSGKQRGQLTVKSSRDLTLLFSAMVCRGRQSEPVEARRGRLWECCQACARP